LLYLYRFIFSKILWTGDFYLHFIDQKIEVEYDEMIFVSSYWQEVEIYGWFRPSSEWL
jgi:hypothetical protein